MSAIFEAMVRIVEENNRKVIDDQTGQEVEVIGLAHVVQLKQEFAAPLFKDCSINHLRGIYIEEDGKPHIDVYTIGGTLYEDEVETFVDLQHHKLSVGKVFQTWIFGMPNGGCNPRPAPVEEKKKPDAKGAAKKSTKKDDKKKDEKPAFTAPQRRAMGLGNAAAPKVVAPEGADKQDPATQQQPQQQSA
jgi:hypothetical protein